MLLAAEQGGIYDLNRIANYYKEGYVTEVNYDEAEKWCSIVLKLCNIDKCILVWFVEITSQFFSLLYH